MQRAPVVFVCENNLYATATPLSMATLNTEVASKAAAYGLPGVAVDGNDVVAVWAAMRDAVDRARAGEGPTLIEAKTYRTVGHHEGDPVIGSYRTQAEVDAWATRCPVATCRRRLGEEFGVASESELAAIEQRVDGVVSDALDFARNSPEPDPATVGRHVLRRADQSARRSAQPRAAGATVTTGWLDAVRDGIAEEMRQQSAHSLFR